MKCLITGATGFIGRALCAQLLERGNSLVPISRTGADLPGGAATHAVDLSSSKLSPDLLEGVDTVFHLAGIAHQRAHSSDYEQLNHRATLQLARDAEAAGVSRFIFLSSVKAMGRSDTTRQRDVMDCALPGDPYGLSKWRAECGLRTEFENSGMTVHIIRPSLVYGAEPKGNLALLSRGIRFGLPRPPGEGGRSMIALPDLVRLLCITAQSEGEGVSTWIASDGQRYSTRQIYELLRKQAGMGRGVSWWPRWCWRLAAASYDWVQPSAESTWDKLFATELYSNAAVCAGLGWAPELTMADVLTAPGGSEASR